MPRSGAPRPSTAGRSHRQEGERTRSLPHDVRSYEDDQFAKSSEVQASTGGNSVRDAVHRFQAAQNTAQV